MSLAFTNSDPATYMSYPPGDFVGSGAHTLALLVDNTVAPLGNIRCMGWMNGASEQNCLLMDTGGLYGQNDFSSGYNGAAAITTTAWRVLALTKASGSVTYRLHKWDYASDGSGTMEHGVATGAGTHADFSAATACRVGWAAGTSMDGLIAVAAFWDRALSDAELDTLKSGSLVAWNALTPKLGVHYKDWTGSAGDTVFSGSSGAGTKNGTTISGAGANPTGFDFALTAPPSGPVLTEAGELLRLEDGTVLLLDP